MYDEKFELLEAKIRETTMLVSRLREEKRQLEWENEQLRARVAELEAHLEQSGDAEARYVPNLDHLLEQLDTLQHEDVSGRAPVASELTSSPTLHASPPPEDPVQRGVILEQQGQYEQALSAYQHALELDGDDLDAAQRLAFLLEKLNRDAEAAALWDKIWAMRESQPATRRRRLR